MFAGYVVERDLRTLLAEARALVFPSLYEGFGLPVLEAMAAGKPVLCSRVTNLPHLAGDAARYFDPNDPNDLASAIAFLEDEPAAVADLVQRGLARAAALGTSRDTARRYLEIFDEVVAVRRV